MENKKDIIKKALAIAFLVLLIVIVFFIMIKYEIEGESNMPFNLSKIMIISTADGVTKDDETISIIQCNDLYFSIEKNDENDDSMIDKVYFEKINVMSEPKKGSVKFYRPQSEGTIVYEGKEEYLISDQIIYSGDSQTSLKNLTISNQGGTIGFRTSIEDIGEINIDAESQSKEISYNNDGTLLQKAQIDISEIKYNIDFDIIIELTDGKMYRGHANLTLPIEDVENNGVKGIEKKDTDKIVFKRIKVR